MLEEQNNKIYLHKNTTFFPVETNSTVFSSSGEGESSESTPAHNQCLSGEPVRPRTGFLIGAVGWISIDTCQSVAYLSSGRCSKIILESINTSPNPLLFGHLR